MTDKDLHIIYVSRLCSEESYDFLFKLSKQTLIPQAQKYNRLMAEGLGEHSGVYIVAVGVPPVNRAITTKYCFAKKSTVENNVTYKSVGIVNLPIIRYISMLIGVFVQVLLLLDRKKKNILICDVLCTSMSIAALAAARLKKIKTIGIVTDLPACFYQNSKSLSKKINKVMISSFSAYLFLTIYMNDVVNIKNRPYVVIEGHSDKQMAKKENLLTGKYPEKVCMYTGGLDKTYGIEILTEAFIQVDIPEAILHIYGKGNYEEELKEITKKHKNIIYGGILPNEQIVEEQIKATLMINPRPTNQEFTKYSFPSKNMEYIASGTPLLTTKLPGMPDEYLPYVYLFEEETIEGYAKTLREILSLPVEKLHAKGLAAKEFAMEHKNNAGQAGKLLQMIREEVLK